MRFILPRTLPSYSFSLVFLGIQYSNINLRIPIFSRISFHSRVMNLDDSIKKCNQNMVTAYSGFFINRIDLVEKSERLDEC